jgi:hypothetical protein
MSVHDAPTRAFTMSDIRNQITKLPKCDQDALIRTIDAFLGKAS